MSGGTIPLSRSFILPALISFASLTKSQQPQPQSQTQTQAQPSTTPDARSGLGLRPLQLQAHADIRPLRTRTPRSPILTKLRSTLKPPGDARSHPHLRPLHLPGQVEAALASPPPPYILSSTPSSPSTPTIPSAPSKAALPAQGKSAGAATVRSKIRPTKLRVQAGIVPTPPRFLLSLTVLLSICFILALSCAFIGLDQDVDQFVLLLNDVANNSPGIVLLGENVDVDIDEPSVGIRWSVLGCGPGFVLNGSAGVHGSVLCGLPAMPLQVFVDGSEEPVFTYDPARLPFGRETSHRRYVQNLVQFDSDHALDVHNSRLYPLDTYALTTTLRIADARNVTLPIARVATISEVAAFSIRSADVETFVCNGTTVDNGDLSTYLGSSPDFPLSNWNTSSNSTSDLPAPSTSISTSTSGTASPTADPTRDLDLAIRRPSQARAYALLLWSANWMLAHGTVGQVVIARTTPPGPGALKGVLKHVVCAFAVLVAIPQLRSAYPDGPDFEGVLIDSIGFIPQMIVTTLSTIALLVLGMLKEFDLDSIESAPAGAIESDASGCSTAISRTSSKS